MRTPQWLRDFQSLPFLLDFVLGPLKEENLRRALALSHANLAVFVQRPISAAFLAARALLILIHIAARLRKSLQRGPWGWRAD